MGKPAIDGDLLSPNHSPDCTDSDPKGDTVASFGHDRGSKLTLFPLIALIFYEVSGGPFGVETSVKYAGPFLAIVGFLIFPILWSIPEALLTAELATALPENGGYVVWTTMAFGDFWGFQQGWWKWLSGVIDNSLYPVLFLDYLMSAVPAIATGPLRFISIIVLCVMMTYLNYRGLSIVGTTAMALLVFSLVPFLVMTFVAIPKVSPRRWFQLPKKEIQWRGFLNSLLWNLNYFDSASTLAGEVEKPRKNFPKALLLSVILIVVTYVVPLMIGTGCVPYSDADDDWNDGYFAVVAGVIGGRWLQYWIIAGAALSNIGLFEAEMSSDSFQLLGMAERGMLPNIFARRSAYNTPTLALLLSSTGIVLISWLRFEQILELLNFLYCISMLVEFATFVQLRLKFPNLERPYRVPLGSIGVSIMLIIPTLIVLFIMCLATWMTISVSAIGCLVGIAVYVLNQEAKKRGFCDFVVNPELPDLKEGPSPHHRNLINPSQDEVLTKDDTQHSNETDRTPFLNNL